MAFLKIHCGYCGGTWDIYSKVRKFNNICRCPHCDAHMDERTWAKILAAFDAMQAANMELVDDHVTRHKPRFEADYINDGMFKDNDKNDVIGVLSEGLNGLRDEVGELRVDIARMGAALEKKG